MKVDPMQKYSLKNRISLILAVTLTLNLPAAIPDGTLSPAEQAVISQALTQIKQYTDSIRAATGNLFAGHTPFTQDFATLTRLRDQSITIHNGITPTGSQLAQVTLINLKGLAHQLSEAQKKWVETLRSKSLINLFKNRQFMATRHDDSLRYLLGAKHGRTHSGDGLIGCLEKSGNNPLRAVAESILTDVEFVFNYAQATRKKEMDLAVHLIKYKGFTPKFIKLIASIFA